METNSVHTYEANDSNIDSRAQKDLGESVAGKALARELSSSRTIGALPSINTSSSLELPGNGVRPSAMSRPESCAIDNEGSGVKAFARGPRPSLSMELGRNWQSDGKGRFVAMGGFGRLVTMDHNGRMVDYAKHVDATRASERTQMAFASILFCSPLMLLGIGASFSVMDQFQNASRDRNMNELKSRLTRQDGSRGAAVTSRASLEKGLNDELIKRAILTASHTRGLAGISDMSNFGQTAIERESKERKKRVFSPSEQQDRRDIRESAYSSRLAAPLSRESSWMNRAKLMKEKRKLENIMEMTRGKINLEEAARMQSRLETLDRALTRLTGLSI